MSLQPVRSMLRSFPLISSRFPSAVSLLGVGGLLLLTGYLIGRLVTSASLPKPSIMVVPDERDPVAVIRLEGVRNGQLEGETKGDVRFFLGDRLILAQSGTLKVPVGSFFTNEIAITIPEGMQFVASKKGTYYYPVDSADGEKIVPENRYYFRDEISAKAAGFKKGR